MSTTELFGLSQHERDALVEALEREEMIERALMFGSRALGNFKRGSDVDIALFGEGVTSDIVRRVEMQLEEETTLPYHFDIIDGRAVTNDALREHIEREGKVLWRRRSTSRS